MYGKINNIDIKYNCNTIQNKTTTMSNYLCTIPFKTFFVLAIIVLFAACTKLPIYKSENLSSDTEMELPKINSNYFDKNNNVHFGIAHNDTHIFMKIIFHEEQSLIKIMRGGLNLYFDPEGNKKKNYELKIERTQKEPIDKTAFSQQDISSPSGRQKNLPSIIDKIFTKVTWDANGKERIFYRDIQKHIIEVDFQPNVYNELVLLVAMPLSELPLADTNLLSMGIETGSVSSPSGNKPSGNMHSSGKMGGRGGGMGGGGSRNGGGGMRGSGGGGSPQGGSSQNASPLKIWFQVEL